MIRNELLKSAKLVEDRYHAIAELKPILLNGVICEVGVYQGFFSEFLLKTLSPSEITLIDLYSLDDNSPKKLFKQSTHYDFIKNKFQSNSNVKIKQGDSVEILSSFPDNYFDFIYIDANHSYDFVKSEIDQAYKKIKSGGIIGFNDYIPYDHILNCDYGVIKAVNEFVNKYNLSVEMFAFHEWGFHDMYVRISK